jgi:TPR repeat protein
VSRRPLRLLAVALALAAAACGTNDNPATKVVARDAAAPAAPDAASAPDAAPAPAPDAAPIRCDAKDLAACVTAAEHVAADDPGQAVTIYKQACEGGVVTGCVRLGQATERGRGTKRDLAAAAALYQTACDKKDADACALSASMYEDGKGVTAATAKAIALYTRACSAGSGLGCTGLGTLEAMGQGTPVDVARALTHFVKACEAGDPVGCLRVGRAYQRGLGTEVSDSKADEVWARLQKDLPARCQGGAARACDVLGILQQQGLGSPADPMGLAKILRGCELGYARACSEAAAFTALKANSDAAAQQLVETACDGGDDLGCALLGKRLISSNQITRALELFERACAAGGETGCVDLAGLYDAGGPVKEDKPRATTYYGRACDGGSFRGCLGLGSRLASATGVKKDEKRARLAADKACKLEPSACWMLAHYLGTGVGGPVDLVSSKRLYTIACDAGEETACPYKDKPEPLAPGPGMSVPSDVDAGASAPPR